MKYLLYLPFSLLLLAPACKKINCECPGSFLAVVFIEDGGKLPPNTFDLLNITSFDADFNPKPETTHFDIISDCQLYLRPEDTGIWVFENEELGIQDTLEILDLSYSVLTNDECDCAPVIQNAQVEINGVAMEGTKFTIDY